MSERLLPGIYGYALARTHHMDEILRQEVAAGVESLVILGAGYDTRAYRMTEELADVRIFEVDHPATSRDKRRRLAKALVSMPANVSFIEADFIDQDLPERLAPNGYEQSGATLFLLSGVSMYLTDDVMGKLFDQVAAHSRRTSLLFDYVDANVLGAPDRYFGKEWIAHATRIGEEPRWGIRSGEAGAILEEHGLDLASDLDADELMARYLRRADGSTVARPFGFGAVAHAFVAG